MRLSVVGGGYVGLVSSICFAELGHSVKLIELEKDKVEMINAGKAPIYEDDLDILLSKHISRDLEVVSDYEDISDSDVSFICVGTPPSSDGSANLSMIISACRSIGDALRSFEGYHVVAVKSTVPPGTTRNLVIPTVLEASRKTVQEVGFCMNPEFLREGRAIQDFMSPDRIVVGSIDDKSGDTIELVYKRLKAPVIRTNLTEAEMIKYASNAFLATKISFANEIGNICKNLGIDVYKVMRGVGLDHRISSHFLNAGVGFGGSCFPKDISALIHLAKGLGEDPILLKSVMEINERQPMRIVDLLERRVGCLSGKRVAVLGLAFKDNTDDVRESRSIKVIMELISKRASVVAYDPKANSSMQKMIPCIEYCQCAAKALENADARLVLTEWPEFGALDKEFDLMKSKIIIEGRKVLSCRDREGICW